MSSTPRMNLNDYTKVTEIFPGETPFNRAISQAYEPGSVAKILTMSSALDNGTVTPVPPSWIPAFLCRRHSHLRLGPGRLGLAGHDRLPGQFAERLPGLGLHPDGRRHLLCLHAALRPRATLTGIDLAGEVPGRLKLPAILTGTRWIWAPMPSDRVLRSPPSRWSWQLPHLPITGKWFTRTSYMLNCGTATRAT